MKKTKIIVFSLLIIFILIATIFLFNYNSNNQLNINTFNKVKMYKFKEGIGFIEYKAKYSQKTAIWNLINNMSPSKNITLRKKAGGYDSFYFINNNIKTIFYLTDIQNDRLFITVLKYDKEGNLLNKFYFLSSTSLAKKINDIILNYNGD